MNQSIRACRVCGIIRAENGAGKRPVMCKDCYNEHRRTKRASSAVDPTCVKCGKQFARRTNSDKLCSPECKYEWDCLRRGSKPLETIKCADCGIDFRQKRVSSKHCSTACSRSARYKVLREQPGFLESRRDKQRMYRYASIDTALAREAEWRANNREAARAASLRWWNENRLRQSPGWWRKYPEKHAAKQRARSRLVREATPYVIMHSVVDARLRAFGYLCWICGGHGDTIDHVKPLSKGGLNIPANMRPACRRCNSRKRDMWLGASRLSELAESIRNSY